MVEVVAHCLRTLKEGNRLVTQIKKIGFKTYQDD